eukprot:3351668-Rhodomonas_salina.1
MHGDEIPGNLPSQLKASLSYMDDRLHDLSEDEISHSIQLAHELLVKLTTEEHVREQTAFINVSMPLETEPGFRVPKDRLVVHMLFGREIGQSILEFGYHPFHAIAIVLIYCTQMVIFLYSLFKPTPQSVVWGAVGMQCYLTFWIVSPVHVDIARAQGLTFEIWYLMFSQVTLFCILIPISVRWDARGVFSMAHGIGCMGAYLCDAMPPIASECIRLGWMAWVCVAAIMIAGYEFDFFFDFERNFTILDNDFNVADMIVSRCMVLGIFGFRYCYTYWHYPRDCMYFKVALVRSDQNERFVILRELGLLPMKNHRRFTDHSNLTHQEFRSVNQKSSSQGKTKARAGLASESEQPLTGGEGTENTAAVDRMAT